MLHHTVIPLDCGSSMDAIIDSRSDEPATLGCTVRDSMCSVQCGAVAFHFAVQRINEATFQWLHLNKTKLTTPWRKQISKPKIHDLCVRHLMILKIFDNIKIIQLSYFELNLNVRENPLHTACQLPSKSDFGHKIILNVHLSANKGAIIQFLPRHIVVSLCF